MADTTTTPDAKKSDHKDNGKAPAKPDFLTQQQDDAKAAISRVLTDMTQSLKSGADVSAWAKQYPWVTAGAAAGAGFLVGLLLTPSKGQPAKQKFAELRNYVTPAPDPIEIAEALAAEKKKQQQPGFMTTILREAMKSIGPMLAGVMSGKMAQPEPEDMHAAAQAAVGNAGGGGGGADLPTGFGVYRDPNYWG